MDGLGLEQKPTAILSIVLLQDFSVQQAYIIGDQVATRKKVVFNGVYPYALPNGQLAEAVGFMLDSSLINDVVEEFHKQAGIPRTATKIGLVKNIQMLEKPLPKDMIK